MWFREDLLPAYREGFEPTLKDLGYTPIRVDQGHQRDKVDDYIMASIRKSALLVADFTGMRSGVFFEAGLALGLNKPVVWTCREDCRGQIGEHFDTRQYPHLLWTDVPDLCKKLRDKIEALGLSRARTNR